MVELACDEAFCLGGLSVWVFALHLFLHFLAHSQQSPSLSFLSKQGHSPFEIVIKHHGCKAARKRCIACVRLIL